ncbi:hypothetical protein [Marinobacter sp. LQ44]|uniref:hypothetical protein n=1 Tax=unclassified Marinobacter TaxID=83889 RepID=UPI000718F36F|nr:hypothetical protein [Marinobacter sp. LQ44]AMQ88327.1 hypothetical protein ASQ50_06250 [Marinobacter sp. LQ44]
MAEADDKFRLIKRLFSEFPDGEWEGLEYKFSSKITEENKGLFDSLNDFGMLLGALRLNVGQEKNLSFLSDQKSEIFVARSIDDLMSHNTYRSKSPERVLLFKPFDFYGLHDEPEGYLLKTYVKVVSLISIIDSIADHEDKSSGEKTLIFLSSEKIEIPIVYGSQDFREWEKYQDFVELFSDKAHRKQKSTVFKKVISDALRDVDAAERFSYFLANFDRLVTRIHQNYDLYVSEFSFERIRKKNKAEIAQHLVRINSVFSDIQTQLLTLPIAGLLAAGQMEAGSSGSIKNLSIVAAALSFAFLLSFVLRNYFSSLKTVKSEIDSQKNSLKEEYKVFASSFEEDYQVVDGRYKSQRRLGRAVDFAVSITLVILPAGLYIYLNHHDFVQFMESLSWVEESFGRMKLCMFAFFEWWGRG